MTINRGQAIATIGPLFPTSLSQHQLSRWRNGNPGIGELIDESIVGEIYWRKNIGHPKPKSGKLADAFNIVAWTVTRFDEPVENITTYTPIPHAVTLWDGKDDDEFWHVSFLVSGVKPGHHPIKFPDITQGEDVPPRPAYDDTTCLVAKFNDVTWVGPGPDSGLSLSKPYRIFVDDFVPLVKSSVEDQRSFQIIESPTAQRPFKTPFDK